MKEILKLPSNDITGEEKNWKNIPVKAEMAHLLPILWTPQTLAPYDYDPDNPIWFRDHIWIIWPFFHDKFASRFEPVDVGKLIRKPRALLINLWAHHIGWLYNKLYDYSEQLTNLKIIVGDTVVHWSKNVSDTLETNPYISTIGRSLSGFIPHRNGIPIKNFVGGDLYFVTTGDEIAKEGNSSFQTYEWDFLAIRRRWSWDAMAFVEDINGEHVEIKGSITWESSVAMSEELQNQIAILNEVKDNFDRLRIVIGLIEDDPSIRTQRGVTGIEEHFWESSQPPPTFEELRVSGLNIALYDYVHHEGTHWAYWVEIIQEVVGSTEPYWLAQKALCQQVANAIPGGYLHIHPWVEPWWERQPLIELVDDVLTFFQREGE